MAERTDFYGSNTPKCPKSPCSFQKTGCSFHSFEQILSKRAKKKSPENRLFTGLFGGELGIRTLGSFWEHSISSRSRYDLFDSPPYISTVFRALRKCKKNRQERYEILKLELGKTLINQGFSAEKTARANAHFECCKTLADSRLEQVVPRRIVKSRKPRHCKELRTFRPVSARGVLNQPRVQIKPRSCVKSLRSCAFARSQARKQRPQQHR